MKLKILLTSTSFQDTPGKHHELLKKNDFDVDYLRGPLKEEEIFNVIDLYDAIICGDDEITEKVILKGKNSKLKVISKYGIGLDKIDMSAAKKYNIPVTNCPGINHTTVAEHVFALLLSFTKNIVDESNHISQHKWIRLIGTELYQKTIGVIGTGNIGKEVIKRAKAFEMNILAFDKFPDNSFAENHNIKYCSSLDELICNSDIISLNVSLNDETKFILNKNNLNKVKNDVIIVNTARAELIEISALINCLKSGKIRGYLTDVLNEEPLNLNDPLLKFKNVIITPHIGSRTFENVEKQGSMAVNNLIKSLNNV